MAAPLKEYNPSEIAMSFAGIPITGYADGEFVTIEPEGDWWNDYVGTDGDVARSRTNDHRVTITFKLAQYSDTNALLSAVMSADRLAPNGAGVGALEIRDLQGTTQLTCAEAWIMGPPTVSFDREIGTREWKIRGAVLDGVIGGN
jgi:hypothetical protein